MTDPFVGTWNLNVEKSAFDANHRPTAGTMVFELDSEGCYLMKAEGRDAQGRKVEERPQRFEPDGQPRPVPGLPGLSAVATRPEPNKLQCEARREDGSIVGQGTYEVSADGRSLTAATAGFDTQLRRFEVRTVWDRA
ncbi:MAG TPA: hypothetical protein VMH28_15350 [Candidatus Acidoferrales bacterium]|nr:hypothetical protein [Candidatus Acidoferrales bacterium]